MWQIFYETLFNNDLSGINFKLCDVVSPQWLLRLWCALFRERKRGLEGINLNMESRVRVKIRESLYHIFIVPFLCWREKCASIMASLQIYFPSHAFWHVFDWMHLFLVSVTCLCCCVVFTNMSYTWNKMNGEKLYIIVWLQRKLLFKK